MKKRGSDEPKYLAKVEKILNSKEF